MDELEPDSSDDEFEEPRVGTDYLGRPVIAYGPKGSPTLVLQDFNGEVGWLDAEGQHWYRFSASLNCFICGSSDLYWRHDWTDCGGSHDSGGHNHVGPVNSAIIRLLRFNFVLRNFFALSGWCPNSQQYDYIARFYAARILDSSTPYLSRLDCPAWVTECVTTRFPYSSESSKCHYSIKVARNSKAPLSCVMELNSLCEYQRFAHFESYTGRIPLDYDQARNVPMPDRTLPYVQRWPIPGNIIIVFCNSESINQTFYLFYHRSRPGVR